MDDDFFVPLPDKDDSASKRRKKNGPLGSDRVLDDMEDDEVHSQPALEDGEDEGEFNADQRRLALAKDYLKDLDDLAGQFSGSEEADVDLVDRHIMEAAKPITVAGMKYRTAELLKESDVFVDRVSSRRAHKLPPTSLTICKNRTAGYSAYTGSKDGSVICWDLSDFTKSVVYHGQKLRHRDLYQDDGTRLYLDQLKAKSTGPCGKITALGASGDGAYVVVASEDKLIYCYRTVSAENRTASTSVRGKEKSVTFGSKERSGEAIEGHWTLDEIFTGHLDVTTGLRFAQNSYQFVSASADRSLRSWNAEQGAFIDVSLGHQAPVVDVDVLGEKRALSASMDISARLWKFDAGTHLVFMGHSAPIDCVRFIDATYFVSGGQDGMLCLWSLRRKKPLCTVKATNGTAWVSSLAVLANTDLVVSGGADGLVRFWRFDPEGKSLESLVDYEVPNGGYVNALEFTGDGSLLVVAVGQEHRLGRWKRLARSRNAVLFMQMPSGLIPSRKRALVDKQYRKSWDVAGGRWLANDVPR